MHTAEYDQLMRNIADMERSLNRVNRELPNEVLT